MNHPVLFFLSTHGAESQGLWETIVNSNFLNFLIAAVFLFWVFTKFNLLSILDKRRDDIVKALKDAEAKRTQAMADLKAIEERTAKLTGEVETIIKDAEASAEMVASGIVKNAEEEAEKIIQNAKRRIEMEEKTAARELESRLMQEAIYGARQLLESTLSDDDRRRSVEAFVSDLPELYQKELQR